MHDPNGVGLMESQGLEDRNVLSMPVPRNRDVTAAAAASSLRSRALPWIWDGIAVAYLLSGRWDYDPRLQALAGISFNQLLGGLLLVRLVWICRGIRRQPIRALATIAAVLALTVALLLRLPASLNPEYGRYKVLSYLLVILPVLVYAEATVRSPADARRLLGLNVVAALFLLGLCIPHLRTLQPGQRLAVLGGGPNVFSRTVGSGLLSAVALSAMLWIEGRKGRGVLLLLWLPLGGIAMLFAGSKAVILALCVSLLAFFWAARWRRLTGGLAAAFVFFTILPLFTNKLVQEQPKDGGLVRMLRLPDVHDSFGSYGSRVRYVRGSLEQIRDHPWFGVGSGSWGTRMGLGPGRSYPHNIILESVTELGILGAAGAFLPLLGLRTLRKHGGVRRDFSRIAGWALVIYWTLNVQFSGDVVDSRYLWWFLALLEIQASGGGMRIPSPYQAPCEESAA